MAEDYVLLFVQNKTKSMGNCEETERERKILIVQFCDDTHTYIRRYIIYYIYYTQLTIKSELFYVFI